MATTGQTYVRFDKEIKAALDVAKRLERRSRNGVICVALEEYFLRHYPHVYRVRKETVERV